MGEILRTAAPGADSDAETPWALFNHMIPAVSSAAIDTFANQRKWREFVAAVQCSVDYSAVVNTLRSGRKFFYDGIVRVSTLSTKR